MMRFGWALIVLSAVVSCKSRNETDSKAAGIVVTGGQLELFTATRGKDTYLPQESLSDGPVATEDAVQNSDPGAELAPFDYESQVCHLTDCTEESYGDNKSIVCKTVAGSAPASAVLKLIEQYPDDEKLSDILLQIIEPGQITYSDTDPDVVRVRKLLANVLRPSTSGGAECELSYDKPSGLSLTQPLNSRKIIVHNKTKSDLVLKAVVRYSQPDWKVYKESPWAEWSFAPGKSGTLSYKNSTEMFSIQFKAYIDGKLVQDNGAGVLFDNSGDEYNVRIDGTAVSKAEAEANQKVRLLSVEQCAGTLQRVQERYTKSWFQNSDYEGERKRCYGAVDEANKGGAKWTPMMKRYYCEHPGIPVRDCFTPLAGLLRKTIFKQKNAYSIGYTYCKNTRGFASMTPQMLHNFKQVMVNNWSPTDIDACWERFSQLAE